MMIQYSWDGEPIKDIHAWCRDRGEQMVKYKAQRSVFNPFAGTRDTETEHGEMPESFFNNMLSMSGGGCGLWIYTEISRYNP